jgi:hypothetical protein
VTVERKYERDVDMLLAEEFLVNPSFASWFASQTKFSGKMSRVADVFVSKSNNMGESDLIVVLETEAGGNVAILIEDKVDAPLQPSQAERYRLRADREVQSGLWTDYEVILCAPRSYLQGRDGIGDFDKQISLEEIGSFLSEAGESPRGKYRGDFLLTAATRRKNTWTREQDDATDAFWTAAYEVATRDFPILEMKPQRLTNNSVGPVLRPRWLPTKPKNTYLWIKGRQGFVDLTFDNTIAYQFGEQIACEMPSGITLHQTGSAAAMRVEIPRFAVPEGVAMGLPKVRIALEACDKLLRFYQANQSVIHDASIKATPIK